MTVETILMSGIAALASVVALLWRENKAKDKKLEAERQRSAQALAAEQKARIKDSDLFLTTLAQWQRRHSERVPAPDRLTPSETPKPARLPPYSPTPSKTTSPTRKSPA